MEYTALELEVIDVIAETLKRNQNEILLTQKIADLSEDSIQLFELLTAFEKRYETTVTYEEVVKLNTVADIVAYVHKKTGTK